ncbi:hypothetical protein DPMN_071759 [Dreissena polymorpha]|uniref:Spondin-like TSP1 domain-containing protein n=1 Tax=Dreissena polymorpha TaxID=45954 RepID=A0A9D3Z399_DREPO|nr:hypothetical protein DPMN_071759 [Dreissena polymorpha]
MVFSSFIHLQVSPWTAWGECLRDCDKGRQARNRTLLVNPICGGTPCPDIMVRTIQARTSRDLRSHAQIF